jgi:YgiT-type zinc finger domain-containing protein
MTCSVCKRATVLERAVFTAELSEACIVVIKSVPTIVCNWCGQQTYTTEVVERIEQITTHYRNAPTEVAVVSYDMATAA